MTSKLTPKDIVLEKFVLIQGTLSDKALSKFLQESFQTIIDDRTLYPAWMCLNCMRGEFGQEAENCPNCNSSRIFSVATFQGRAPAVGAIFQEACILIIEKYFPKLGIIPSTETPYRHHCDLYLPQVAGIEAKGSPSYIIAPDGSKIEFGRPGMRRTDTEKKANSNASTFKEDFKRRERLSNPKFYVLTNALPERGWQEEHSFFDGVYDVTKLEHWENFISDLEHDISRAKREILGRR